MGETDFLNVMHTAAKELDRLLSDPKPKDKTWRVAVTEMARIVADQYNEWLR